MIDPNTDTADRLEDVLEKIKDHLQATIDVPIPGHCHCCPNRYEEGLETERDYASDLLDNITLWEMADG